jgi:hypothetical protein
MKDRKEKKGKKRRCGHGVEGFYIQPAHSNVLLVLSSTSLYSTIFSSSLPARISQVRHNVGSCTQQGSSQVGTES